MKGMSNYGSEVYAVSEKNRHADDLLGIGLILILLGFMGALFGALPSFSNSTLVGLGVFLCVIGVPMLIIGLAMGGKLEGGKEKKTEPQSICPSSPVITKEKEVIVREVVMVPCSYCGGLMPQTATYCPHCGARRKS